MCRDCAKFVRWCTCTILPQYGAGASETCTNFLQFSKKCNFITGTKLHGQKMSQPQTENKKHFFCQNFFSLFFPNITVCRWLHLGQKVSWALVLSLALAALFCTEIYCVLGESVLVFHGQCLSSWSPLSPTRVEVRWAAGIVVDLPRCQVLVIPTLSASWLEWAV